jgi:hypothetical protein
MELDERPIQYEIYPNLPGRFLGRLRRGQEGRDA